VHWARSQKGKGKLWGVFVGVFVVGVREWVFSDEFDADGENLLVFHLVDFFYLLKGEEQYDTDESWAWETVLLEKLYFFFFVYACAPDNFLTYTRI
jgi:hypothetical protein